MKIMAFNGSPRKKKWNTVTLLEHALQGAASAGAETEMIHLYDLAFSGCVSCFSCKKRNRAVDGVCALQDELADVLDRIKQADALIVGTPVYYGAETAATRAFLERLLFPYYSYAKDNRSLFPRRIPTAIIYTMNVDEKMCYTRGYDHHFEIARASLQNTFGDCTVLLVTDTLQYADYDQFEHERFDKDAKLHRHHTVFPKDCEQAFLLGRSLVSGSR